MKSFEYVIKDEIGIHARPAGMLSKIAKEFGSEIIISKGDKSAVASKLMALMGLGVKCGDTILVSISGADEDTAAEKIKSFLENNL